jgi:hypothetical protein
MRRRGCGARAQSMGLLELRIAHDFYRSMTSPESLDARRAGCAQRECLHMRRARDVCTASALCWATAESGEAVGASGHRGRKGGEVGIINSSSFFDARQALISSFIHWR